MIVWLYGVLMPFSTVFHLYRSSLCTYPCYPEVLLILSLTTNFNASKLKEFADDNFKFDENGREFSKWVENTAGKRRNCSLRAISPFPKVFSKGLHCRHVKSSACLGEG